MEKKIFKYLWFGVILILAILNFRILFSQNYKSAFVQTPCATPGEVLTFYRAEDTLTIIAVCTTDVYGLCSVNLSSTGNYKIKYGTRWRAENPWIKILGDTAYTLDLSTRKLNNIRFADRYTSIQAAINSLPASGGTVFIPAGTYQIDSVINLTGKSNITIQGAGKNSTILRAKNNLNDNIFLIQRLTSVYDSNLTISDLTIDGNRGNQGNEAVYGLFGIIFCNVISGAEAKAVQNVLIKNVDLMKCKEQGIRIYGDNISLSDVMVDSCKWDGVQLSGNKIIVDGINVTRTTQDNGMEISYGNEVTISNSIFSNNTSSSAGLLIRASKNVTISNCIARKNTYGFWIWNGLSNEKSEQITITGCTADSNDIGIRIYADSSTVQGINITGNVIKYSKLDGIHFRQESGVRISNCLVSTNICYDNGMSINGVNQAGIFIHNARQIDIHDNICYDSRASGKTQLWGLREFGTADSNRIINNYFHGNQNEQPSLVGASTIVFNPNYDKPFRLTNTWFEGTAELALFASTYLHFQCSQNIYMDGSNSFLLRDQAHSDSTRFQVDYATGKVFPQRLIIPNGAGATRPSSPSTGEVYFVNTATADTLFIYDGTAWRYTILTQ
jgi:parallel beta-helix repeat protein